MACCALRRRRRTSVSTEILVRSSWLTALGTLGTALLPLGAVSPRARLWRDFTAMLEDAERHDAACQVDAPQGMPHLRRALAGRLLRHSPAAAGFVWRRLDHVRPGALADVAAGFAARALENG